MCRLGDGARANVQPFSSCLLQGPHGCGKPSLVHALAHEHGDVEVLAILAGRRLDRPREQSIAVIPITLAISQPGRILRALRSRLPRMEIDPYSRGKMARIADETAPALGLELDSAAAGLLAEFSNGIPRAIDRRLAAMELYFNSVELVTYIRVEEFLAHEGIDRNGLAPLQRGCAA